MNEDEYCATMADIEREHRAFFWHNWGELNKDKSYNWLCRAYRNLACDVMKARDPEIEEIGSSDINCVLSDMWLSVSDANHPKLLSKPDTWFTMQDYYFGKQGLYDKPEETS